MGDFDKSKYKFSTDQKVKLVGSETIERRRYEADLFKQALDEYNVLIKDLIIDSPSYSIRNIILNISYYIIDDIEIFEYMSENKRLPIERLINRMPIASPFFSKWNDYIIAYMIILSNPNLSHLDDYLNILDNIKILGVDEIKEENVVKEHRGIIIEVKGKRAVILTSKGEFKKIDVDRNKTIGEDITGKEKKTIGYYKLHMGILLSLIILMGSIIAIKYNSINTILLIETTSEIKMEVNSFNRVLSVSTATDKGKEMLKNVRLIDNKLDTALYEVLNYALLNDMIPKSGVIITVTGKAIEYGELSKSEDFISKNGFEVKFNNSGNEHKLRY